MPRSVRRFLLIGTITAALTLIGCAPANLSTTSRPSPQSPTSAQATVQPPKTSPTSSTPNQSAAVTQSPKPTTSSAPASVPPQNPSTPIVTPPKSSPSGKPTHRPSKKPGHGKRPGHGKPDHPRTKFKLKPGANHIAEADSYVVPAKQVQRWLRGLEKPANKTVFLTFDDGPNHKTTPVILKALRDSGVHATFYVVGSVVGEAPDMLRQEVAEGNAINLHSWSHDYGLLYPGRVANAAQIEHEYLKTIAAVRGILGEDFNTQGWRYPGGHMSWQGLSAADDALAGYGVSWIDWNADTRDSAPKKERPKTIAEVVKNATEPIRQGQQVAVILGHDTPDKKITSESVGAIVDAYRSAGYRFAVVS